MHHTARKNKIVFRPLPPPTPCRWRTLSGFVKPVPKMRPEFLPPLVIPVQKTQPPVLLWHERQQRHVQQPGHQYRPWHPRPNPYSDRHSSPVVLTPAPAYEAEPSPSSATSSISSSISSRSTSSTPELDDLALFPFYHPCLLPPPSIPTVSHASPPPPYREVDAPESPVVPTPDQYYHRAESRFTTSTLRRSRQVTAGGRGRGRTSRRAQRQPTRRPAVDTAVGPPPQSSRASSRSRSRSRPRRRLPLHHRIITGTSAAAASSTSTSTTTTTSTAAGPEQITAMNPTSTTFTIPPSPDTYTDVGTGTLGTGTIDSVLQLYGLGEQHHHHQQRPSSPPPPLPPLPPLPPQPPHSDAPSSPTSVYHPHPYSPGPPSEPDPDRDWDRGWRLADDEEVGERERDALRELLGAIDDFLGQSSGEFGGNNGGAAGWVGLSGLVDEVGNGGRSDGGTTTCSIDSGSTGGNGSGAATVITNCRDVWWRGLREALL